MDEVENVDAPGEAEAGFCLVRLRISGVGQTLKSDTLNSIITFAFFVYSTKTYSIDLSFSRETRGLD